MNKLQKRLRRSKSYPYKLHVYRGKTPIALYLVDRKWRAVFKDDEGFIPELSVTIEPREIGDYARRIIAEQCGYFDDGTVCNCRGPESLRFVLEENLVAPKANYGTYTFYQAEHRAANHAPLTWRLKF